MGTKLLITRSFLSVGKRGSVVDVDWDAETVQKFVDAGHGAEVVAPKRRPAAKAVQRDVVTEVDAKKDTDKKVADGEGDDQ